MTLPPQFREWFQCFRWKTPIINNISKRDLKTKLVSDVKPFEGVSFYPKEYNGKKTYTAVYGDDTEFTGYVAFKYEGDVLFAFPLTTDLDFTFQLLPALTECNFIKYWGNKPTDLDIAKDTIRDYATSFNFQGELSFTQNTPTKDNPYSYTLQINAGVPRKQAELSDVRGLAQQLLSRIKGNE